MRALSILFLLVAIICGIAVSIHPTIARFGFTVLALVCSIGFACMEVSYEGARDE